MGPTLGEDIALVTWSKTKLINQELIKLEELVPSVEGYEERRCKVGKLWSGTSVELKTLKNADLANEQYMGTLAGTLF
ncbi:hypothetical protein ACROYT_G013453 [Oculina patagonica]